MMNNEFTIMLIACLCTVTTIVVVMFINTTCAFQEKLDEQEKIIEREKIIHRQREEDHERKLLKKEVEYEKKLERAFALIETCNTKINELVLLDKETVIKQDIKSNEDVLLNKESTDKQQPENMIYCNKTHCQILARQDDESEKCDELHQITQYVKINVEFKHSHDVENTNMGKEDMFKEGKYNILIFADGTYYYIYRSDFMWPIKKYSDNFRGNVGKIYYLAESGKTIVMEFTGVETHSHEYYDYIKYELDHQSYKKGIAYGPSYNEDQNLKDEINHIIKCMLDPSEKKWDTGSFQAEIEYDLMSRNDALYEFIDPCHVAQ